ncbi:hypothetical protein FRC03_002311 [Tulasnella sp. 419]|nr:hypothetical protein FRC03_002311 [Tulasnella sp. 419]
MLCAEEDMMDATLAEASKQEPNLVLMVPTLGAQPVSTHLRETNSSKQTVNPRTHSYARLRNPGAILLLPTGNLGMQYKTPFEFYLIFYEHRFQHSNHDR